MLDLSIGLSSLRAHQTALSVVAQNIANANTPGYHRQVAQLADRPPLLWNGHYLGTGVEVSTIRRVVDIVTEEATTRNVSEQGDVEIRLRVARQLESLMATGTGTLHERLTALFDSLERLTAQPSDDAVRQIVLRQASELARAINDLADQIQQMQSQLDAELETTLDEINAQAEQLRGILRDVRVREAIPGANANDLLDQRDRLVNQLAQLIDVRIQEQGTGPPVVVVGESALVGDTPLGLSIMTDDEGNAMIMKRGFTEPVKVHSGRLAGLFAARHEMLRDFQNQLQDFTTALVTAVDGVHGTGLPIGGGFELLQGQRGVEFPSLPLGQLDRNLPVPAGEIVISVTDPTGVRRLQTLTIDPATQSLEDVAAAIGAVDHLDATVESQSGTLVVAAEDGYTFDFVARLETDPDPSLITGTTRPQLDGWYQGTTNQQFTFTWLNSGTVGLTPGLKLEVRDGSGDLRAILDVGQGYEPGSAITAVDGIEVRLSSGTANAGDSFSTTAYGQTNNASFVASLGLNSLLVGDDPGTLAVHPDLLADARRLASTKTGQPADTENLIQMVRLRDQWRFSDSGATLLQYLENWVANVGADARDFDQIRSNLQLISQNLEMERQRISGVDPNEELVQMLQMQRGFQAAARYLTTVQELTQTLLTMLRP